ncbi:glycosyltransferase family 2 protein [Clostridium tyrobutyricum]|uniref:glycosyltransferase family 2 protein n=1 Tax=Clostridium tyrobutyricum TaxID=1519 RepID=UPI0039F698D9
MKKFTFVILHYKALESTINTIESILKNIKYYEYNIVVVDNFSNNSSYTKIYNRYRYNDKIHLIETGYNLGFAKGNNFGYFYAKQKLNADFIVTINNDVEIVQSSFLHEILKIYDENKFCVLGPDIISTRSGQHQNPIRNKVFTTKSLNKYLLILKIKLFIAKLLKKMNIYSKITNIKNTKYKKNVQNRINKENTNQHGLVFDKIQKNIILDGSCYIFSDLYINKNDLAFYPETFLFFEEDILSYFCLKKGYTIIYDPRIQIIHHEDISTEKVCNSEVDKKIFQLHYAIQSGKIFMKLLRKYDTN